MARQDIDYKEYSRLRDIAHKRVVRAQQAGFKVNIALPTVKQVRASENPYWFMQELRKFVGGQTTVGAIRASGKKTVAVEYQPKWPAIPQIRTETEIEKKIRKQASARRTRQRRAIKEIAPEGKYNRLSGYLKSAQTIAQQWLQVGKATGDVNYLQNANWLMNMTAGQAKAFAAYAEYRFSQGDFVNRYAIKTFVEDFVEMAQKGRNLTNLQKDFDMFLADQSVLRGHAAETNQYGMSASEMTSLWNKFVKG